MKNVKADIENGEVFLGLELGSTRIKAVLTDAANKVLAAGGRDWENRLENGVWTYSMDEVWAGAAGCYRKLKEDVRAKYGVTLKKIKCIGVSAMMHGYLVFDKDDKLLAPFRTWRNTMTERAAAELSALFGFNIPQRWSIAHLYQAVLNKETHVKDISSLNTLAGYVHYILTGNRVLGAGDASGMFPLDENCRYNAAMLEKFDKAAAGFPWKIGDILPKVLPAGANGGFLTARGARLLDVDGDLESGCMLCPPEGDAGTGMAATNSGAAGTGNVSAGTSVFAILVLKGGLKSAHPEIDVAATPAGKPVAMVHCNNCTSEINAWAGLFGEFSQSINGGITKDDIFSLLYGKALEGRADGGGLLPCNYLSGEHITGFGRGVPLFLRKEGCSFTLANFMRAQLYSAAASLALGMEILKGENVVISKICGHGGFFKSAAGGRVMAAALNTPVSVTAAAGEGGAWGAALLAAFASERASAPNGKGMTLEQFLDNAFKGAETVTFEPKQEDVKGFETFLNDYKKLLAVEKTAVGLF